jgi:hypothetical protein
MSKVKFAYPNAAVAVAVLSGLLCSCNSNSEGDAAKNKTITELTTRVSRLEKRLADDEGRLQNIPRQQDLDPIKESIQSVKPQLERLEPLLAAFFIKREPGEREEQWLARVKQEVGNNDAETALGFPVVSNEVNCEGGGIRLTVLSVRPFKKITTVYIEFNGRVDTEVHVDVAGTYLTTNTGRRFRLLSFDKTHLAPENDSVIRLHAGERITTYFQVAPIDLTVKAFQLYWPSCGIIDFVPKSGLAILE